MTKEEVISKIKQKHPGSEVTCLIEFPDTYVYNLDGEKSQGLVNWTALNKNTGEFEMRSFFDLDDEHMTKLI